MNESVRKFTCDLCKTSWVTGWKECDALKEMKHDWPGIQKEECGVVCDDCHEAFMKWCRAKGLQ